MENEFVQYREARELRNLGFNYKCFKTYQYFEGDGKYYISDIYSDNVGNDEVMYCAAPTFSQAFRWFRENHGYHAYVETVLKKGFEDKDVLYGANYKLMILNVTYGIKLCKTYEEAELACLRKLIEIVKNNKQ